MSNRFVIDETSWKFDSLTVEQCNTALEGLLDQIELATQHQHQVHYSEELFSQAVWQNKSICDLLACDSQFRLSPEVNERIWPIINRLTMWQDLHLPQPACEDIHCAGGIEKAASLAWAVTQTSANAADAVAGLILDVPMPTRRSKGMHHITLAGSSKSVPIWLVGTADSYQNFFRWIITETSQNPADMAALARSAFAHLDFIEGAFAGIKDMEKPYRTLVADLVKHLAALSDHGPRIFTDTSWQDVPQHFGQFGVVLSLESGNTKKNSGAKKERTRQHNGKEYVFWWHTKLERHQNRIHFSPDDVKSKGSILIGIFCLHLTT